MSRSALVSVWNKEGLEPFIRGLISHGIEILSTGGTAKFLQEKGITVRLIEQYTGHPEVFDGRVKTLHPKVHGGILARRDNPNDLHFWLAYLVQIFDFVVVNLYPFADKLEEFSKQGQVLDDEIIEYIDIGGPTMIRSAAKNFKDVTVISDPADYAVVLSELSAGGGVSAPTKRRLAGKVFATMAAYDGAVARYFGGQVDGIPQVESQVLLLDQALRYGENPHQRAGLYRRYEVGGSASKPRFWRQIQGKELSYNNLLDMHAALDLLGELLPLSGRGHGQQAAAVIVKHNNPCGVALRADAVDAFKAARACDPTSAFGGIIALSAPLSAQVAEVIVEQFVEVVLAPSLQAEARAVFEKKKNLRVIEVDVEALTQAIRIGGLQCRAMYGDYLVQTQDNQLVDLVNEFVVTKSKPDARLFEDLRFAWAVCKHVKSNVIVIAKDRQAFGIGAGQMSRVDSARIAIQRAKDHGFSIDGAVAASDAFLPFPDTLEILNDAGVKALVQPGGSVKDQEVVECADRRGAVMLMCGERHFRH